MNFFTLLKRIGKLIAFGLYFLIGIFEPSIFQIGNSEKTPLKKKLERLIIFFLLMVICFGLVFYFRK
jgi:hypothetical protein